MGAWPKCCGRGLMMEAWLFTAFPPPSPPSAPPQPQTPPPGCPLVFLGLLCLLLILLLLAGVFAVWGLGGGRSHVGIFYGGGGGWGDIWLIWGVKIGVPNPFHGK